jgi:transketolase
MVSLYFHKIKHNPKKPEWQDRDRFILSKGHGCSALYAVLAHRGFFGKEVLDGFAMDEGSLGLHPTCDILKGIEVSTGSLGHGLSIGAGIAVAARYNNANYKVYVLLSDGEMDEGSTWEAAMFASHHKLDNFIAIVDYNRLQALGRIDEVVNLEPLAERWRSFGWEPKEISGHNFEGIIGAFKNVPFCRKKPSVVIAHTIKGKGVSFMEDELLWHYRCPDEAEYKKALEELGKVK